MEHMESSEGRPMPPSSSEERCIACGLWLPKDQLTFHELVDWFGTSLKPWCAKCRKLFNQARGVKQ